MNLNRRPSATALVIALFALVASSACSTIFPAHPHSEYLEDEEIILLVQHGALPIDHIETDTPPLAAGALAALAAPVTEWALGRALDKAGELIQKEADRYTATYSANSLGEFKANGKDIRGFTLTRRARAGDGSESLPTSHLRFEIDGDPESETDGLTVSLTDVFVRSSKAKVFDASWNLDRWPGFWSRIPFAFGFIYDVLFAIGIIDWGDAQVDVNVKASMEVTWVDGERKTNREKLFEFEKTQADMSISQNNESSKGFVCGIYDVRDDNGEPKLTFIRSDTLKEEALRLAATSAASEDYRLARAGLEKASQTVGEKATCKIHHVHYPKNGRPQLSTRPVPKSYTGSGWVPVKRFDLTAQIVESDDFGELLAKGSTGIEKNKEDWIKKALKRFFPEDKKESEE